MMTQSQPNTTTSAALAAEFTPLLGTLRRVLTPVLEGDTAPQAQRVLALLERGSRQDIPAAEIEEVLYRLVRDLVSLRNARLAFEADPDSPSGARVVSANGGAVVIGKALTALLKMSVAIAPELVLPLAKFALRTDREQHHAISRMIAQKDPERIHRSG